MAQLWRVVSRLCAGSGKGLEPVIWSLERDGFGEAGRAYGSTSHDWWAALVEEEKWDWRQVLLPPNLMIF